MEGLGKLALYSLQAGTVNFVVWPDLWGKGRVEEDRRQGLNVFPALRLICVMKESVKSSRIGKPLKLLQSFFLANSVGMWSRSF